PRRHRPLGEGLFPPRLSAAGLDRRADARLERVRRAAGRQAAERLVDQLFEVLGRAFHGGYGERVSWLAPLRAMIAARAVRARRMSVFTLARDTPSFL